MEDSVPHGPFWLAATHLLATAINPEVLQPGILPTPDFSNYLYLKLLLFCMKAVLAVYLISSNLLFLSLRKSDCTHLDCCWMIYLSPYWRWHSSSVVKTTYYLLMKMTWSLSLLVCSVWLFFYVSPRTHCTWFCGEYALIRLERIMGALMSENLSLSFPALKIYLVYISTIHVYLESLYTFGWTSRHHLLNTFEWI